jgi:hypothetical protein
MAAPQDDNRNKAARLPANQRMRLEESVRVDKQTRRVPNKRSALAEEPLETPMFPAGSLVDNLIVNKTTRAGRLIFIQSVIGPRGTRQYQYEVEDSGQCFWSYRPLGFWL